VFPDISPCSQFFHDGNGCIVDGNCYWITPKPGQDANLLFLILGLANSSLMARYHDLSFANRLYAGRRRYLTQYVGKYPIPDPSSAPARHIMRLVRELVASPVRAEALTDAEQQIEVEVARAFGVDPLSPGGGP
jgi:hypothetical protein